MQGIVELPLTGEIAVLAGELESLHGDPADRFIAATAIRHDATLVTADEKAAPLAPLATPAERRALI